MKKIKKTREELSQELMALKKENASLKALLEKEIDENKNSAEKPDSKAHLVPEDIKESTNENEITVNGIDIVWDLTTGVCKFRGLQVAMMWVDTTLAGLMSGVAQMVGPERFALALQAEGRKSVESDWFLISRFPDFKDGFKALNVNAAVAAWGDWQLIDYQIENKKCIFRAFNNWEGLYQKALGVCWGSGMLAGKFAGICSKLFNINCWATQTKFVAKGDDFDEFIVEISSRSIEEEIEKLLFTEKATYADLSVAYQKIKNTEKELIITKEKAEESELKYRSLIENSSDAIFCVDEKGEYKFTNYLFASTFGKTPEYFIGKTFWDVYDKENADFRYKAVKRLFKTGKSESIEVEVPLPDKTLYFLATNNPIKDESGNVILNLTYATDITKRKQHEIEILKLSQAVQQSPVSIVITNLQGTIEYVNPRVIEVTGYTSEELIGQNWAIFGLGNEPEELSIDLWSTISSAHEWRGEFHNKKKNGELFWESAIISPIINDKNVITNFIAIKEDITEKKRMIDELIMAKDKAEEMNRIKSSFFANMSHELRTPLIGVLGFAEMLEDELADKKNLSVMAQTIRVSGQRLMKTLNFILDIAKLESDKVRLNLQQTNIVASLKEITDLFSTIASRKGLEFSYNPSQEEIFCTIDIGLFANVIDNLLNNALKFTDSGSLVVNVFTRDTKAVIEIIDTGIGISKEDQDIVWEEFRQASEGIGRHYQGTGLGLTISKKYSEIMGGTISLRGELGSGTTFTVEFPLTEFVIKELPRQEISELRHKQINEREHARYCILFVEDEDFVSVFVSLMLKDTYILDIATNGEEAIKKAASNRYDAILMDINLGYGMNGIEVTKAVRKMQGYKDTPIIACTAYAMESEKEEFITNGLSHYLSKPFTKHELLSQLEIVFDRQ